MFKEMRFGRVDILWLKAISCILRAESGLEWGGREDPAEADRRCERRYAGTIVGLKISDSTWNERLDSCDFGHLQSSTLLPNATMHNERISCVPGP